MYGLINEIIKKYNGNYEIAVHVPLNMIIRDLGLMSDDEKKYAKNDWTHVDFLIYKTIDKSPVLAIEVDGSKKLTLFRSRVGKTSKLLKDFDNEINAYINKLKKIKKIDIQDLIGDTK